MKLQTFFACALSAITISGAEYYVDISRNEPGTGTREKPFSQFYQAASKVKPGDTIFLVPKEKPVFQKNANLLIVNLKGTEEKPITIDGQMIIITGAKRAVEPEWTAEKDGIYSKAIKTDDIRFFMTFNGKLERMGRLSKWNRTPLKSKDDLKEFEWTIQNGIVFFRLPAGKTLADIIVEYPVTSNGISIGGKTTQNLIIKNIIVQNFLNDGFNIHQKCINIHFENIAALECGDDGLSAHTASLITVKNFVSWNNSVGICHVGKMTVSRQENVLLSHNASRDIFCLNPDNIFRNLVVYRKSPGGVDQKNCSFENCWIDTMESQEKQTVIIENLKRVFADKLPDKAWKR